MSTSFTIAGLAELRAEMAAMPKGMRDDGQDITDDAAQRAYDVVYQNLPVRTGYLRSRLAVVAGRPGPTDAETYLVNRASYAHFVEWGTHDTPPQPVFTREWARGEVEMWLALARMARDKGFQVTGSV